MLRRSFILFAWLCLTPWAWAHSEQILSLTVTNVAGASGYLIASDADAGGAEYNRENIAARAEIRFSSTNTARTLSYEYLVDFQLLDSLGQPVAILDRSGATNTTYTVEQEVTLPTGIPPFVIFNQVTRTVNAPLVPTVRLSPFGTYRVDMKLRKRAAGVGRYTLLAISAATAPTTYYHFTSRQSADPALNVIAALDAAAYQRSYLVSSIAGLEAIPVAVDFTLRRYDGYQSAPAAANVSVRFDFELTDAVTGLPVPLVSSSLTVTRSVSSHGFALIGFPIPPTTLTSSEVVELRPSGQLDPVGKLYRATVRLSHVEVPAQAPVPANSLTLANRRMLHFNGKLLFGGIETRFTSLGNVPVAGVPTASAVPTSLVIPAGGGFIRDHAGHTYGSGAALPVVLRSNGDAEYTGAPNVAVNQPAPDTNRVANVRFERSSMFLNTAGAFGTVKVWLPSGFGYRNDVNSRILLGTLSFGNLGLTQALLPISDPAYTPPVLYGCEETKPLWFEGTELRWAVGSGRFGLKATGRAVYVRQQELARLRAAPVPAADRLKRSNEAWFEYVDTVTVPEIVIGTHTDGSARLDFEAKVQPGAFVSHFPYDSRVRFPGGGDLAVKGDQVVPSGSRLTGVTPVRVAYSRDCSDPDCGPGKGADGLDLDPDGGELVVTPDGGLAKPGKVVTPKELTWGWISEPSIQQYAQRVDAFGEGAFHMPGSFLRGDQATLNVLHRAGILLFSGVGNADPSVVERFGQTAYEAGLGDYAGLNFRVGVNGAKQARSVLGGEPAGPYPLRGRDKYYVRLGGVSGIHEAVLGSFNAAKIYGYDFKFTNYGLSYLDSLNWESRTEGAVIVKAPSDFSLRFEELKFTCLGALDTAKVPAGEGDKVLVFWQADFKPLAIRFDRQAGAACNPGEGYLTVGVEAWAQHIDATLFGTLGWHPNGNLITRADAVLDPPFDSRLKLPNTFKIRGPKKGSGNEQYTFTPVNDAYYSNWDFHKTAPGFINVAGKLDVPFFEDLKVHLHTSADRDGTSAPIYLMGGWPSKGFTIAGQNFFNTNPADPDNRGFPADTTVEGYRQGDTDGNQKYLVRAQRNWLGVVDLDYPLRWSDTTRAFTAFEKVEDDLLVLHVQHEAKYLSAENAELVFGAQYTGIPQINLANFAFDQLGGLQDAFTGAVLAPAREAIDDGVHRLDQMLQDQMHAFYGQTFDTLFDPVIDNLYEALKVDYLANAGSFSGGSPGPIIASYITGGGNSIVNRLNGIVDGAGLPEQFDVLKQLDENLGRVETALGQVEAILAKDPGGNRQIVGQLIKNIVGELAAQFVGAFVDDKLNQFLKEVDPSLSQVQQAISDLHGVITTVRGTLAPAKEFRQELKAKLASLAGTVNGVATQVRTDVDAIFAQIGALGDNPFTHYTKAELKARIRQKLEDRFFGSVIASSFQEIIKQRLYDVDAAIREGVDSLFQQINTIIKDVISQSLAEVDKTINGFLGECSSVLGAGKINGYAHINGDALKLLRLDIYAQFKVPSEMEFNGYLQIKELDSEGTASACLPKSGKATEVTFGATDVEVNWISQGVTVSANAKFTFDSGGPVPVLVNLGGGLELKGEIDFETFKIKYLGASMGFGLLENYFSAAARVAINKYEGMGGIFFGKTCSLEPFFWDKDVQALLGTPPFTGAYAYVEVWIPVSEALLGIPATCLFEISAGVGAGAGFFLEGPTYVGKMFLGVHGSLLCILSVSGEIKLLGIKNADGLRLKGNGKLSAELGWCPFCVSVSKSVGLEYKNGSWDVDF